MTVICVEGDVATFGQNRRPLSGCLLLNLALERLELLLKVFDSLLEVLAVLECVFIEDGPQENVKAAKLVILVLLWHQVIAGRAVCRQVRQAYGLFLCKV